MSATVPRDLDERRIRAALREAWSPLTARQWTPDNRAGGQCNVTALLIHARFGGEILKTCLPEGAHFYNRIGGRRYDFTDLQFATPVTYEDIPSGRAEASESVTEAEVRALDLAFQRAYADSA